MPTVQISRRTPWVKSEECRGEAAVGDYVWTLLAAGSMPSSASGAKECVHFTVIIDCPPYGRITWYSPPYRRPSPRRGGPGQRATLGNEDIYIVELKLLTQIRHETEIVSVNDLVQRIDYVHGHYTMRRSVNIDNN